MDCFITKNNLRVNATKWKERLGKETEAEK